MGGENIFGFAAVTRWIREQDPNHPIWANQAPRQSISLFKRWYRFVDIGGSDIYPWWDDNTPDKHSDLPNKTISVVGDECTKNLTAIGAGKPVLMTIQAFGWSENSRDKELASAGYTYPPTNILRFMAYDAIVSGAGGVLFFQDLRYRLEVNSKVKPVSLELRALHDVLASETVDAGIKSQRVRILTKKYKGNLYVIAANRTKESFDVVINVPGTTWQDVISGEKVVLKNGGIKSNFAPWGVKIFTNGDFKVNLL